MQKYTVAGVKISVEKVEDADVMKKIIDTFSKIAPNGYIEKTVVDDNTASFYIGDKAYSITEGTPSEFFSVTKDMATAFADKMAVPMDTLLRATVIKLAQKWYNRRVARVLSANKLMDDVTASRLTVPHYITARIY